MNETNYWEQFCDSGKVEDYLKFKEQTDGYKGSGGEKVSAGFSSCNRDDNQGSAYR